jgi:hypothetical protein
MAGPQALRRSAGPVWRGFVDRLNAFVCLAPVNLTYHYHDEQSYKVVWFSFVRIRQTGSFSSAACRHARRDAIASEKAHK